MLGALRVLVFLKQHSPAVLRAIVLPLRLVGKFVLRFIAVPLYRIVFFLKRTAHAAGVRRLGDATAVFTNRYAIHAALFAIMMVVGFMNLGRASVRAESFGSESVLFALVSRDLGTSTLVTVTAEDIFERRVSQYLNDGSIDVSVHQDFDYEGEPYVSVTTPVADLSPTVMPEIAPSTANRDAVETFVIESGDSLYSISARFGLNVSTLLWANDLNLQSLIRPGQKITIPPTDGVLYKVKSGDTVSSIAKKYSADADKMIAFNNLADANDLVIGETLMVPGGKVAAPVIRRTAPVRSLFKGGVAGGGGLLWPTDWRVITQYYGWRHTGLDVDGDYSTFSYASAAGTVTYSGWLGGYGLMVDVDHGSGLKTRYAHHSKNFVKVGDTVAAGQALAQTGSTGRSTGTHLHFEVFRNGKRQNPLDYIR